MQRSTLADANAKRSSEVFSKLFTHMVADAGRGLRRKIGEATYSIDLAGIRLSGIGSAWAHFSSKACGAKVQVIYDADAERAVYAAVDIPLKHAYSFSGRTVLTKQMMIKVFIGFDPKEAVAYDVSANSIIRMSSELLSLTPLSLNNLEGYSERYTNGSNEFPRICKCTDDRRMVPRTDVHELLGPKAV